MDRTLENRLIRIPEKIRQIQDDTTKVLDGISRWTKEEDYVQLRLLLPRLKNLISRIDALSDEIDSCLGETEGDKAAEMTVNALLQQKASLLNERSVIGKIQDDVSLSSNLIEDSERIRLSGEILERCRTFQHTVKEML